MPAQSEAQRRMMAADYERAKEGKKTRTGMSMSQLRDFMSKPKGKKLPYHKKAKD